MIRLFKFTLIFTLSSRNPRGHPMNCRPVFSGIALILTFLPAGPGLLAQSASRSKAAKPASSLQTQIDELKMIQKQNQKDLEEIKALLKAQAGRMESPAARPQEVFTVNVFGEPFKGDPSARVAILEYSDFDCSYCAKYATEIYPLIDHAYIKAGTVKYFFRDLPLPEHPSALFKARLARCAGDQERFWEAHDRLFRDQKPFDAAVMAQFIQELKLDEAAFKACISSDRYIDAIQRSANGAARMRINGTPAFIIGALSQDGGILQAVKVFLGADSFEAFRNTLDGLLKPAEPLAKAAPSH